MEVQVPGILIPGESGGPWSGHQVQADQIVVEARGAIEVVDDGADVARTGYHASGGGSPRLHRRRRRHRGNAEGRRESHGRRALHPL